VDWTYANLAEFNDRLREAMLHRREWLNVLGIALKQISLHQQKAASLIGRLGQVYFICLFPAF